MAGQTLRVLVVDDNASVRRGIIAKFSVKKMISKLFVRRWMATMPFANKRTSA